MTDHDTVMAALCLLSLGQLALTAAVLKVAGRIKQGPPGPIGYQGVAGEPGMPAANDPRPGVDLDRPGVAGLPGVRGDRP